MTISLEHDLTVSSEDDTLLVFVDSTSSELVWPSLDSELSLMGQPEGWLSYSLVVESSTGSSWSWVLEQLGWSAKRWVLASCSFSWSPCAIGDGDVGDVTMPNWTSSCWVGCSELNNNGSDGVSSSAWFSTTGFSTIVNRQACGTSSNSEV